VRQQLPEDAGYPLNVNGVGPVHPGDVFDAPLPVPGCRLLDPPPAPDGADGPQDGPADPAAGDGDGGGVPEPTGPQGDGADPAAGDPPAERAPARRNSSKGARA